jgi:hypothetical protein
MKRFIRYDQRTVATHEMGHAAIACVAGIQFQPIKIKRDNNAGWAGSCHPVTLSGLSQIEKDSFQMGGPLMQIIRCGDSLRGLRRIFEKSLFTYADQLSQANDLRLNYLLWDSDLYKKGIMSDAYELQCSRCSRFALGRNWLFALEVQIRQLFHSKRVRKFVDEMVRRLLIDCAVDSAVVQTHFKRTVPAQTYAGLIQLLNSHKQP